MAWYNPFRRKKASPTVGPDVTSGDNNGAIAQTPNSDSTAPDGKEGRKFPLAEGLKEAEILLKVEHAAAELKKRLEVVKPLGHQIAGALEGGTSESEIIDMLAEYLDRSQKIKGFTTREDGPDSKRLLVQVTNPRGATLPDETYTINEFLMMKGNARALVELQDLKRTIKTIETNPDPDATREKKKDGRNWATYLFLRRNDPKLNTTKIEEKKENKDKSLDEIGQTEGPQDNFLNAHGVNYIGNKLLEIEQHEGYGVDAGGLSRVNGHTSHRNGSPDRLEWEIPALNGDGAHLPATNHSQTNGFAHDDDDLPNWSAPASHADNFIAGQLDDDDDVPAKPVERYSQADRARASVQKPMDPADIEMLAGDILYAISTGADNGIRSQEMSDTLKAALYKHIPTTESIADIFVFHDKDAPERLGAHMEDGTIYPLKDYLVLNGSRRALDRLNEIRESGNELKEAAFLDECKNKGICLEKPAAVEIAKEIGELPWAEGGKTLGELSGEQRGHEGHQLGEWMRGSRWREREQSRQADTAEVPVGLH